MKTFIFLAVGMLMVMDSAYANRNGRVRPKPIENLEKPKSKEEVKAVEGRKEQNNKRVEDSFERMARDKIIQVVNNSGRHLTNVHGLMVIARANPKQNLPKMLDLLNKRRLELEESSSTLANEKRMVIEEVFNMYEALASRNVKELDRMLAEDARLLNDFVQVYILDRATVNNKSNTWQKRGLENLAEFLRDVAANAGNMEMVSVNGRNMERFMSLKTMVERHGRFTYREFKDKCKG